MQSGIEEDLLIQADPIDLEVIGDEPLSFGSLGRRRVEPSLDAAPAEEPEPLEIVIEPEPERVIVSPPPAAPPTPPPAARPTPPPAARPRRPRGSRRSRRGRPLPRRDLPHVRRPRGRRRPRPAPACRASRSSRTSRARRSSSSPRAWSSTASRPATCVIREGEEGTSFYVVASGRFAVSKRDEAGGTVVLAKLGEGDFFGEMALLSGAARSATVTARGGRRGPRVPRGRAPRHRGAPPARRAVAPAVLPPAAPRERDGGEPRSSGRSSAASASSSWSGSARAR